MSEEKFRNKMVDVPELDSQLEILVAEGLMLETKVIYKIGLTNHFRYKKEAKQDSGYKKTSIGYLKETPVCELFQTTELMITMNPRNVRKVIRRTASPSISKKEYEDRVERMAKSVLNDYPDDIPIEERIWQVADSSAMVIYYDKMAAPICHSENEPSDLGVYAESGGVSGIAFGHLQADIREKVRQRQNSSSNQGGGSHA
jgi:hypothetical protein